ncbi:MAG: CDP-glucose 4,6-dehydratase, partial [Thermodesulfobacteriota bacterium]
MEGMEVNPNFWKDKRVLITGHTGFKGGWLSLWLSSLGAIVTGYSLQPEDEPNLFKLARVKDDMTSIIGDIRDLEHIGRVMAEHKPEIIFHMAAQSLVRYSYDHPIETYSTNVMGTVNVLEAVRKSDCTKVVVNITSDKCYENQERLLGYREDEPMGGWDPYSSSKGCAELVTSAYMRSYFSADNNRISVATTRAGNVIGGGDWSKDRLIPDLMRSIIDGRPTVIRNPDAVRPWQHVLEPLCGYMVVAERLWEDGNDFSGGWNFGPNDDDARPVSWIADKLTEMWGDGSSWTLDDAIHPHEATYLKLDCSKAKNALNWTPKINLSTALEWVVEWYRDFKNGNDIRGVTEEQISRYTKL